MSRQISAIVRNTSSSLDFFDCRSFSFGSFCLGGNVLLAGAAFAAADDFIAVAGRDLRFGAIMCERVAEGVQGFWPGFGIIPTAATLPVIASSCKRAFRTAGEHHGRSLSTMCSAFDAVHMTAGPRPF